MRKLCHISCQELCRFLMDGVTSHVKSCASVDHVGQYHSFLHPDIVLCCFLVARTCSLIFMVLDVLKPLQHKKLLEHELEGFGIRLNKTPPNIGFRKKEKGGLNLTSTVCLSDSSTFSSCYFVLVAYVSGLDRCAYICVSCMYMCVCTCVCCT